MKAVVLTQTSPIETRPLQTTTLPDPCPKDSEILVEVSVCGVCHTDLDEVEGQLAPARLPIVLGHQVVGKVADKGKAVTGHRLGDRVGVTWLYWSCGCCEFCKAGLENLCGRAKWTGKDADGGYAEYMVVSQDFAHPIPAIYVDSQAAPLLCAGVIGYRAIRLSDIHNGETVGLFGFGSSAHIVIQMIRHRFPDSPIFVFTRSDAHKQLAKNLGAAWAGSPGQNPPAMIKKAIDFTPIGESVCHALATLDKAGRLVINAIRKTTPISPLDYAGHLWHEKEVKSVANVTRRDVEEFLPLAGEIPIIPKVTEFDLDQANDALLAVKHASLQGAAVLRTR